MNVRPHTPEPYGPCTSLVRAFLVRFAGLGADAKRAIVRHHESLIDRADFQVAETVLGETIARSGRVDTRDALAGPLLQLVRRAPGTTGLAANTTSTPAEDHPLADLEPIAEPALAALMAVMVSDLLPAETRDLLYAPFATFIPLHTMGVAPAGTASATSEAATSNAATSEAATSNAATSEAASNDATLSDASAH